MKRTHLIGIAVFSLFLGACNPNPSESPSESTENTVTEPNRVDGTADGALSVAFIYGDTINKHYDFLIDARRELESEEKVIQERINRKIQRAENRYRELQQQAATMTQADMQEAQLELQNLDLEIQQFQEKLATDYRKRETELQSEYVQKIDDFLDEFNADGRYDMILNYQRGGNVLWIKQAYDITDTILAALNERYAADMAAKRDSAAANTK